MVKNKGYKYRLKPTSEQREYLEKAFGCTRKIYNLYVDSLYSQLEAQDFESGKIDLKSLEFQSPASIKKEYPYMKEIDSLAFCNAQINFKDALKHYNKQHDGKTYTKKAKRQMKTKDRELTFRDLKGMPSFKSKKKNQFSFTTNNQNGTISIIDDTYLKIPKLKTPIRMIMHRDLHEGSVIKSATISKTITGHYEVSVLVEYEHETSIKPIDNALGLDYAQNGLYVDSEGKKANYPKFYRQTEDKLKREQIKLSRKIKGSSRWIKQKKKISKLQSKTARQRLDWLHKQSYFIAENYNVVAVEDLDLRNLAQCLSLGKNLHDNGFGIFRTLLEYKLNDRGKHFIKVDKYFPSSKNCSGCHNHKDDLKLSDRIYICKHCGLIIDRDLNAAINIKEEGLRLLLQMLLAS